MLFLLQPLFSKVWSAHKSVWMDKNIVYYAFAWKIFHLSGKVWLPICILLLVQNILLVTLLNGHLKKDSYCTSIAKGKAKFY